jgi:P27 family predicted phage terminase small subunit
VIDFRERLVFGMPRTKKPAGQAVDRRNGRRADLALAGGQSVERPEPPASLGDEARKQWDAYWEDAAALVQTSADRGVVLRWIDAVDRYVRTLSEADKKPLVKGSTGQLVENPLYKIAERSLSTVERAEKQLGIGALNRAGLGIAVIAEQRSLADMNSRYGGGVDGGDQSPEVEEEDPRFVVIDGEA